MPHVLVKLASGRSEEQKIRLAEEIAKVVMSTLDSEEAAISVAIEEVRPEDWMAAVYEPEIREKWETVYKKPGYGPS
jgi:4-oxalocrotonate tautomerase